MAEATAAPISLQCNDCGARMRVPAAKAGKRGKCPKCGTTLDIPAASEPEAPPPVAPAVTDDGRIKFACDSCGKSLKVPAAAAGRRVKCPQCQTAVTVPDPNAVFSDESGGDDDLFAGIATNATPALPLAPPPAPPMISASGSAGGGSAAGAAAVLGAAGAMGGLVANPLLLGIVFSAVGAAIGGAIWCGIAYKTQYEIGWIAWGVGALAGVGMRLGFRDVGNFPGMLAAGMATLGIIGGKFAVFYLVLQPLFAALADSSSITREELADLIARRAVIDGGTASLEDDEEKFEAAVAVEIPKAEAEVAKMSEAQVRDRATHLTQRLRADTESEMRSAFWKVMFSPWDILWFGLATFTAYRVGNGGVLGSDD